MVFGAGFQLALSVGRELDFLRYRFIPRWQFRGPHELVVSFILAGFETLLDFVGGFEPFWVDREVDRRFMVAQRMGREIFDRRRSRGRGDRGQAAKAGEGEDRQCDEDELV